MQGNCNSLRYHKLWRSRRRFSFDFWPSLCQKYVWRNTVSSIGSIILAIASLSYFQPIGIPQSPGKNSMRNYRMSSYDYLIAGGPLYTQRQNVHIMRTSLAIAASYTIIKVKNLGDLTRSNDGLSLFSCYYFICLSSSLCYERNENKFDVKFPH